MHPTARWDGPLVGRDAQLADLRARFDRVVADGSPATVLVTGEPGSGRTRLVTEFAASLDAANVLHVGCAPADGGGARWPLAALVEALAGLDPLAPAEPARARLATLFEGQPDGDDVVPHLASMIALEGPSDPDHVRWALRRLIEVTAARPADDRARRRRRSRRGGLRATRSPTSPPPPATRRCSSSSPPPARPRVCPRSGCPRLDREAVHALVDQLLGASEEGVGAALAARMSGLPLAIEQSLAMLTESGTLGARERPLDAARRSDPRAVAGHDGRCDPAAPPDAAAARARGPRHGRRRRRARRDGPPARGRARRRPARCARLPAGPRGARVPGRGGRRDVPVPPRAPAGGDDDRRARTGRRPSRTNGSDVTSRPRPASRVWRWAEEIGAHLEASCRLRPDAPDADHDDALTFLSWAATAAVDQGDLDGAARLERRAATLTDDDPARRAELLYLAAEHMAIVRCPIARPTERSPRPRSPPPSPATTWTGGCACSAPAPDDRRARGRARRRAFDGRRRDRGVR